MLKTLIAFLTCILAVQDVSLLSFQSNNLWWFPELQKTYTDLLRSPGKPSIGVLWCLLIPWLLYACLLALAVGHIWLQMFPFLLKEKESSLSPVDFY